MPQVPVDSAGDPRLAAYRDLPRTNLTRHSGLFIAEGDKLVDRLVASQLPVDSILAEPEQAARYAALVDPTVPIYVGTRALLEAVIGFNFHRGVLASGRRPPAVSLSQALASERGSLLNAGETTVVVCSEVQDPTNLGSIVRSAAAFGCAAIVLGTRCADPFSRRVLRVSMGAAFTLPIFASSELGADLQRLAAHGFDTVATVIDPAAEPLRSAGRVQRLALVLGSEGHGLPQEIQRQCNRRVTIPMEAGSDSLNVAVAAAVFLYHFTQTTR
jgi:tRNA G18 (ribose-2'-O)-methylase SpoU